MYACACAPWYTGRSWGVIFRSGFSPHITWVLGMKLRAPGFVASAFKWATSPAQHWCLKTACTLIVWCFSPYLAIGYYIYETVPLCPWLWATLWISLSFFAVYRGGTDSIKHQMPFVHKLLPWRNGEPGTQCICIWTLSIVEGIQTIDTQERPWKQNTHTLGYLKKKKCIAAIFLGEPVKKPRLFSQITKKLECITQPWKTGGLHMERTGVSSEDDLGSLSKPPNLTS